MSQDGSSRGEIEAHLARSRSRRRVGIIAAAVVAVVAIAGGVTFSVLNREGGSATATGDQLTPLTIADTAQKRFSGQDRRGGPREGPRHRVHQLR